METPEDSEYQVLSAFLKFPKEKRETFMEEIRKIDQLIQDLDVHIETSKKGILGLQDNWDDEGAARVFRGDLVENHRISTIIFKTNMDAFHLHSFSEDLTGPRWEH